jgi:hypothetical protein
MVSFKNNLELFPDEKYHFPFNVVMIPKRSLSSRIDPFFMFRILFFEGCSSGKTGGSNH